MTLDLDRITDRVAAVREALRNLSRLAGMPERERSDRDRAASFRYHVVVAAEACVEIAAHVISRKGFRPPRGYKDAFNVLREEGIVDDAVCAAMRGLAGARNLVVHRYWTVDDERLGREVVAALPAVDAFLARIGSLAGT